MEMNILDIRLFWDCTKQGGRNLTHFIHFILHYYNENEGAAMLFLCSGVVTKTNNSYLFVISQINICTKHLEAQTRAANKVWVREALHELKLLLWLLLEPRGMSALSWLGSATSAPPMQKRSHTGSSAKAWGRANRAADDSLWRTDTLSYSPGCCCSLYNPTWSNIWAHTAGIGHWSIHYWLLLSSGLCPELQVPGCSTARSPLLVLCSGVCKDPDPVLWLNRDNAAQPTCITNEYTVVIIKKHTRKLG